MWAELAEIVRGNATETIIVSIVGTVLVWLYKQFKTMIDREQQDKLTTAQLKQGLFTRLELSIASVLHLNSEESKQQMYALLGECGPYLTSTQRSVIRDYYKNFDPALLYSLQALIVSEVDKLSQQMDKLKEDRESNEWFYYFKRLIAPVGPIFLGILVVSYVIFIFAGVSQGTNLWVKVNHVLLGVVMLVSLTILSSTILLLVRQEMGKQGVKRWVAISVIVFSPALIFIASRLDLSIIVLLIQVLMFVVMFKIKRPPAIIRP